MRRPSDPRAALLCTALALIAHAPCAAATMHAIVFAGGAGGWFGNEPAFYYETTRLYTTLVHDYGYPASNVHVYFSDGLDDGIDGMRRDAEGNYYGVNTPWDLDGDGMADIRGPATRAALESAFEDVAGVIQPEDTFLFWTLGHGFYYWLDTYIATWEGAELEDFVSDKDMPAWADTLSAGTQIFVFGQCSGGGFIEELSGEGRIIVTACRRGEITFGTECSPSGDDTWEFVNQWWRAVARDDEGRVNPDADTNADGFVSMYEAFVYARDNDYSALAGYTNPQWDDPSGIGDSMHLGGWISSDPIPEPATVALVLLGLAAIWFRKSVRGNHISSREGG